jgi:hypothetical protein
MEPAIRISDSAKVFPKHFLAPPAKGEKEVGFLF